MTYLEKRRIQTRLIAFLFPVLPYATLSQVTIGALDEPHPSAVLELKAPDKGFLGPRVALKDIWDKTTVPDYTDGLMVLNTNDSGVEVPVGDRVKAGKYYYWSTDELAGGRWIQIIGMQTLEENVEQAFANFGIPRPAVFVLNGQEHIYNHNSIDPSATYDDMLGVINLLEGIYPTSNPNYAYLPLKERVNYTSGTVKLDSTNLSGGRKKFTITFQPGIYSIVFTYEFVPANTAKRPDGSTYPAGDDECYSAVYFMQFPVSIRNNDGTITTKLTRVESNCYHGLGSRKLYEGRYSDHGNTITYVAVLLTETEWDVAMGTGHGDDKCNGKQGLSMPNRSTFLHIARLGDAN